MSAPQRLSAEEFARAFAEIHPPFDSQEAVLEANRCLFCFDAPCTAACPTHIDVPRFIKKIASGNMPGSARTILDSNVLGLSCARVCPVNVLCEGACVMHRYNKKPIEIGRLQRHAMDYFYSSGTKLPVSANGTKAARIACVGAGPASLACAAELRRHGYAVTIFESRSLPGGLNTYGVAEYKLRPPDSLLEVEFIRALGVEFRTGMTVGRDVSLDEIEKDYDAIFVGLGLGPTEKLNIPGENLAGVIEAVEFIAKYKTAAPIPAGRRVVVVGAGNTAIDAAVASRLLGAEQVTITYRRGEAEMPAFSFEYEHAKSQGVQFLWQTQPVEIISEDGRNACGLNCLRTEPGPPDSTGRRRPQACPGSDFHIPCDAVIIALGQTRLTRLLADRGVDFAGGCVVADSANGQTSNPRYFAGGDCVNGGREVVDAVAEGKRAGQGIAAWLENGNG